MSQTIRIPMPPYDPELGLSDADSDVAIEARFPLSTTQWEYLQNVLATMKPAIVSDKNLTTNPLDGLQ
ncbi:MAG: hypothetical protein GY925_26305 [Actinomycetia bacterium]|nr:hypothetical protein [Actinomycetes bacterium]